MGTSFLPGGPGKREDFGKSCGFVVELEALVMLFDNPVKVVSLRKRVHGSDFIIAILIMVYFPLEINK